jgi:hypothetical protein
MRRKLAAASNYRPTAALRGQCSYSSNIGSRHSASSAAVQRCASSYSSYSSLCSGSPIAPLAAFQELDAAAASIHYFL